jgi:lipopolysaccharide transport system permease protein
MTDLLIKRPSVPARVQFRTAEVFAVRKGWKAGGRRHGRRIENRDGRDEFQGIRPQRLAGQTNGGSLSADVATGRGDRRWATGRRLVGRVEPAPSGNTMSTPSTTAPPSATIRIEPTRGWFALGLREVWAYRELLYFLVWRDIKVRYKQTVLGVAWVVIQPLATAAIFAFILGRLASLPSGGVPYLIFVFAALLPWQLFSGALTRAGASLVASSNLLTKVYFPRLVVPLAAVLSGLVDFMVSLVILGVLMVRYRVAPSWNLLTLPVFVLLALLAAFGAGLWLSALNVQYRDVQQLIPFLAQAWMFLSPVVYSEELIPAGTVRLLYNLNPITGVVQGFRWALFGAPPPTAITLVSAVLVSLATLAGLVYFKRVEDTFADVV